MKLLKNETVEKNIVKLTIEVDKEAFAAAVEKSYKKNVKKIAIPGFRKGKAPRNIIEKYYGKGIFWEDAVNFVCPDAYEFAVKEAGIDPVDRPEIDIETLEEDKELVLTATVTVRPEVELGQYMGISADKKNYRTKVADVDAELKAAREKNARMINVEDRAVKKGDFTVIDYEGFVDGVAFAGGKGQDHNLEIGSGQFIPGFEDALVGAKIGVEKEINVTFPEEYHAEDLAGKPVVFKIKLHGIKVRELPELDDEFVKDISEFDTLDELKADLEKNMTEAKQANADREFEGKLLDMVAESVEGEIPECMIEKAIDDMIQDMDYRLRMQGLDFKTYLMYTGMDEKVVREQYKDQAAKDVKLMLAIEKIVATEGLDATEEEINAHYQKFADGYGMAIEEIKKVVSEKTAKNDITSRKAIDLIVDSAKATKPKKTAAKKTTTKKTAKKAEAAEEAPAEETAE